MANAQDDSLVPHPDHDDEDYRTHKATQEEQQQQQDIAPPLSEPRDVRGVLSNSHQLQDSKSNIDEHEVYDEGSAQAALDLPASNLDPKDASVANYESPDSSGEAGATG